MPVSMLIKESPIVLDQIVLNLNKASAVTKEGIKTTLQKLGPEIVKVIQAQFWPDHYYTGGLAKSVFYSTTEMGNLTTLEVGPTLKRGRWDAGKLLEGGTGPNPRAPFRPIAAWAVSKGLPPGPIWQKIRREGTEAHPFIGAAYNESLPIIEQAVNELGDVVVASIVE